MWSFGTNRRHRAALLKPDISLELVGEGRLEMMAHELALWPVDHSDRPFEQRQRQSFGQLSPYSLTPVREAAGKTGAAESLDSFVCPRRAAGSLIAGEKCSEVFEHNRPRHYEICRPSSCEW